ncbi:MAG: hypothetical protein AB1715_10475, partial [Acidobacteriota bacterium]
RDGFLRGKGCQIIRFSDLEVLKETDGVLEVILKFLSWAHPHWPDKSILPPPLLSKGGRKRGGNAQ